MKGTDSPLRVVALGTYDTGKPRSRILLEGLRQNGIQVIECHQPVWSGIEDKSQLRGAGSKLLVAWRLLTAYPSLVWRYMRLPAHDVVLIGYLGLFDVLILWPFIRLRRARLAWDVFLSLYNTVVEDRQMLSRYNPASIVLWLLEWTALRLVDLALMDTKAHAEYLAKTFKRPIERIGYVFVGAEPGAFDLTLQNRGRPSPPGVAKRVLFYGQFIPLHGIETVVRAAKLTEHAPIEWLIIGRGQEAEKITRLIDEIQPKKLKWLEWVDYEKLVEYLADCDVALGIFGTSDKAQRVIPNKVYQILLANRPLVTSDTPAARELLENSDGVRLVPPGNPQALANAVIALSSVEPGEQPILPTLDKTEITPLGIGRRLATLLGGMTPQPESCR